MRTHPGWIAALLFVAAMPAFAGTSDYDGDGRADVFWRNAVTGANTIWRSADATTQQATTGVTNARWIVVGEGDFDGDGRADLFWRNRSTGANAIWRSGRAATPQLVVGVSNPDWQVAGVGDFDADGVSDVFWRNLRTGANAIWRSANVATQRAVAPAGPLAVVAGVGDFDGDGADDVLWRNRATGANAYWPAADVTRARILATVADPNWHVEAIGDFDADGRSDVFWHRRDDGRSVVWRSAEAVLAVAVVRSAHPGLEVAAAGDFDGDGADDVLWRDYIAGNNAIWRSASAAMPRAVAAVQNRLWLVQPYAAQPTDPTLFAPNLGVAEGNSGTRTVGVPVLLSHVSVVPVAYAFFLQAEFDTAVQGEDFVLPATAPLGFAPGETLSSVPLVVMGDTTPEPNEYFRAYIAEQAGASLLHPGCTVTLLNDDANALWIEDARVIEGNSGTRPMVFTVQLTRPSASPVTFDIATAPHAAQYFVATPDVDYLSRNSVGVVLPPGATRLTFAVPIVGDMFAEPIGEILDVNITNVSGAVLTVGQVSGFILDDDPPIIP